MEFHEESFIREINGGRKKGGLRGGRGVRSQIVKRGTGEKTLRAAKESNILLGRPAQRGCSEKTNIGSAPGAHLGDIGPNKRKREKQSGPCFLRAAG